MLRKFARRAGQPDLALSVCCCTMLAPGVPWPGTFTAPSLPAKRAAACCAMLVPGLLLGCGASAPLHCFFAESGTLLVLAF